MSQKVNGRIIRLATNPAEARVYILIIAHASDVKDFTLGNVTLQQVKEDVKHE